ncbi:hypothetical protein [Rhodococcus koreensis]|uniref:hypothetical protein n=1 Tax=Rhodococcus koreensis TaxID=99653 RepID=UPI00366BE9A5
MNMPRLDGNPPTHLFYGGTYPYDLYDLDVLRALSRTSPWLTVVPVAENRDNPWWFPGTSTLPAGMHDRVTGQLGRVVAEYADWADRDIQVVGAPSMIRTTEYRLMAAGLDSRDIHHDPLY